MASVMWESSSSNIYKPFLKQQANPGARLKHLLELDRQANYELNANNPGTLPYEMRVYALMAIKAEIKKEQVNREFLLATTPPKTTKDKGVKNAQG